MIGDVTAADGPPVVLLHGWGGSTACTWDANGWSAALRRRNRRVIGIDVLGHGTAPAPADPQNYADLTGAIERQLPPDVRLDVVGYSLGGKLALELACRGRVRRLVILGLGENAFRREHPDAIVAGLRGHIDPSAPQIVQDMISAGLASGNRPEALAACLMRPRNPDLTPERVARIASQTLLVSGDRDDFIGSMAPLAGALADVRVRTIAGLDHLGTPSSRDVRRLAVDFLTASEDRRNGASAIGVL
jgi:pimeloyl-ACP methyl ester carboxylesterase